MPADRRTLRSPLLVATLLLILVVESTGVVIARSQAGQASGWARSVGGAVAPVGAVVGAASGTASVTTTGEPDPRLAARTLAVVRATVRPAGTEWTGRSTDETPAPTARSESKAGSGGDDKGGAGGGSTRLTGRNKVWIPSLGIRRSVSGYACSSRAYPGNRVYRWGCAGSNNVYLFGHAHSVFKPLHDVYVRGKLRKGMQVLYADGRGRVSTYKVIWWKVVAPDKGAFAYAAQSKPSMTLQTCVGAKSQYRLVVRLVKVS